MASTPHDELFSTATRRTVCWLAIVVGIVLGWIQSARSDDWMFRRSYYSHARQPGEEWLYPEPVSRSAYRRAYVGNGPGFAARGGWRYNTTVLRSGNSFDVQVNHEGWFELTP